MRGGLIIVIIGLFITCRAGAQPQTNAPSASKTVTVEKPKFHWLAPVKKTESRNNLKRVEGLNPRAWTTIAGWHSYESGFSDIEPRKSELYLFWFGHEPWL